MSPFWQTVSGILASIGGAGVIIACVVKFTINRIADQLTIQYKNELDKELLKIKADLENDSHSYQVKFDKEFNLYGKLMDSFFEMVKKVYWLFPSGLDYPPTDESEKKAFYEKRYNDAYESLKNAQLNLASNSIFIPDDIYKRFENILTLSRIQFEKFPFCGQLVAVNGVNAILQAQIGCYTRTDQIQDEYDSLVKYLREYIANQLK